MTPTRLDNPFDLINHPKDKIPFPPVYNGVTFHGRSANIAVIDGRPVYANWGKPISSEELIPEVEEELHYVTMQTKRLEEWLALVKE